MSSKRQMSQLGPVSAVCVVFATLLAAGRVQAQPAVSQTIVAEDAITDEFGLPLKGNDPAAEFFGLPVVQGDLVQILLTPDGVIYPPSVTGDPDPRNQVLLTTRIGRGTSPKQLTPGNFGAALTPRPGGNSRIFVRAFNAPSLGQASFYGDSQLFTVKSWANELFTAQIDATDKPLDAADDDSDGLNNSWEQSYGTDSATADSDGDGLVDGAETAAGTDPMDESSVLRFSQVLPGGGQDLLLRWDSSAGRSYRVEYAVLTGSGEPSYTEVATIVGDGATAEVRVPNGLNGDLGCYRVCVVN